MRWRASCANARTGATPGASPACPRRAGFCPGSRSRGSCCPRRGRVRAARRAVRAARWSAPTRTGSWRARWRTGSGPGGRGPGPAPLARDDGDPSSAGLEAPAGEGPQLLGRVVAPRPSRRPRVYGRRLASGGSGRGHRRRRRREPRIWCSWSSSTAFSCCPASGSPGWPRTCCPVDGAPGRGLEGGARDPAAGGLHVCGTRAPRHLLSCGRVEPLRRTDLGPAAGRPCDRAEGGVDPALGRGLARGPVSGAGRRPRYHVGAVAARERRLGRHRVWPRFASRRPRAHAGAGDGPGLGERSGRVPARDLPVRRRAEGRVPAVVQRPGHDGTHPRSPRRSHGRTLPAGAGRPRPAGHHNAEVQRALQDERAGEPWRRGLGHPGNPCPFHAGGDRGPPPARRDRSTPPSARARKPRTRDATEREGTAAPDRDAVKPESVRWLQGLARHRHCMPEASSVRRSS